MTTVNLLSCNQDRPDRRAISRIIEDIGGVDAGEASQMTDILLEGSPVEVEIYFNESSAFRALRKADIDYEIVE